jgi:hypothetical protein
LAFLRRLLFYIIGIGLGALLVTAFFGDRDFDYAYGPGPRVKKVFRTKAVDSTSLNTGLIDLSVDSLYYEAIVDSKVLFSESDTRKEPCGEYVLSTEIRGAAYKLYLENCDSVVRVIRIESLEN